jgi:hypothetical protein
MTSHEEILSAVKRLDANPEELTIAIDQWRRELLSRTRGGDDRKSGIALLKELLGLRVRLVSGGTKDLATLLTDLKASIAPEAFNRIGSHSVWDEGPFRALGALPVSRDDSGLNQTHVRDLFPAFGEELSRKIPVRRREDKGHTYWVNMSKSWWTTLLYTRYTASTRTTASGWEACDILGGTYAAAKEACSTLVVPPDGDPNQFIIAFLKTAACNYANNAPETPFPSVSIQTIVCSCMVVGANGSCDPYEIYPGHSEYHLDSECSEKTETATAGPVDAAYNHWPFDGPTCLGVTSRHAVTIVPGLDVLEFYC